VFGSSRRGSSPWVVGSGARDGHGRSLREHPLLAPVSRGVKRGADLAPRTDLRSGRNRHSQAPSCDRSHMTLRVVRRFVSSGSLVVHGCGQMVPGADIRSPVMRGCGEKVPGADIASRRGQLLGWCRPARVGLTVDRDAFSRLSRSGDGRALRSRRSPATNRRAERSLPTSSHLEGVCPCPVAEPCSSRP
jgi:hypothetical protein